MKRPNTPAHHVLVDVLDNIDDPYDNPGYIQMLRVTRPVRIWISGALAGSSIYGVISRLAEK